MNIQVEISFYPLGTERYDAPIKEFIAAVERKELKIEAGAMSSVVSGNGKALFSLLGDIIDRFMEKYSCVFVLKVSNACPV